MTSPTPLQATALVTRAGNITTVTVPFALAMGVVKTWNFESREDWDDRAYRLHYNAGQNRADSFASLGAVAGLGWAASIVRPTMLKQWVGAAAFGAGCGILAHVATSKLGRNPNAMFEELKK